MKNYRKLFVAIVRNRSDDLREFFRSMAISDFRDPVGVFGYNALQTAVQSSDPQIIEEILEFFKKHENHKKSLPKYSQ